MYIVVLLFLVVGELILGVSCLYYLLTIYFIIFSTLIPNAYPNTLRFF
jgi:hypothetical protein